MIHPRSVHVLEQNDALHLAERFRREQLLLRRKALVRLRKQRRQQFFAFQRLQLLRRIPQVFIPADIA